MSVVERFRSNENLPMVLTLQYPKDKPVIEFTVKRASQAIKNNAQIEAWKHGDENFDMWFCYELVPQLQMHGHFTGWKALDGGIMPNFNKDNLRQFLDSLTIDERVMLGLSYLNAAAEKEEKKSETPTTSEKDSSQP